MTQHDYPARIPAAVPRGLALVHNTVRPAQRQGARGFRFWLQAPDERLVRCTCGWAPHLTAHYRVRPGGDLRPGPVGAPPGPVDEDEDEDEVPF